MSSGYRIADMEEFKKLQNIGTTRKNRRNKARRKARKREWKANNPKPEPRNAMDVVKAVSEKRKAANR